MKSKESSKQKREHHEFEAFAKQAGFAIVKGSLESKPFPSPDIEVELEGLGRRAFELTNLNPSISHYVWKLMESGAFPMMEHLSALPSKDRKAFLAKYSNAWIKLGFNYSTPPPSKKITFGKTIPEIFDWLLALPDDYDGDAFDYTGNPMDFSDVQKVVGKNAERRKRLYFLTQLCVKRTSKTGPIAFMINAGGHAQKLVIEKVEEKLSKPYSSQYPMELLLTIRRSIPSFPDDLDEIKKVVAQLLPTSSFERVWFHASTISRVWTVGER